MNQFQDITFLYPYTFILLLLYIVCQKICKVKAQSIYFSNIKMLKQVSSKNNIFINILKFLILFFMVFSLASPVKKQDTTLNDNKGYEISLLLDVSAGMRDDDKFKITKEIVKEFIKKRETDRLALSVFANFAYVAVPLTYDKNSLLQTLNYLEIGVAGYRDTALYEALYLGSDIFKNSTTKNKIAILLTDGLNTVDTISLDTALRKAKKYGIKVYTIGIGESTYFNTKELEKIAKETGGKYYEANEPQKLKDIYNDIDKLEKSKIETIKYNYYEYFFQYTVYIAIFLLFILIILNNKKSYNYTQHFNQDMINKIFLNSVNKKISFYLLIGSFIFLIITAFRPTIEGKNTNVSSSNASFIIAFDISTSMQCEDIYPSRFEFMKNKFYTIVDNLNTQRVGIFGFAKEPYLIAPITNDYNSLKYIVERLTTKNIDTKGSNIMPILEKTNEFLDKLEQKVLLILTDGIEKEDFNDEIKYANKHNIKVFIYTIATIKGGVIKLIDRRKEYILKDQNNNIVITSLNENIKQLSVQTNGKYMNHSLNSLDINKILQPIKDILQKEQIEKNKIKNNIELFYIPLILSLIFYTLATTGILGKQR